MAADREGTLFVGAGRTIFRIGPDRIAMPAYQLAEGERVRSLALRPDGAVYAAIQGEILRFTPGGERQHVAGTGANGYSGDGGAAAVAEIGDVEAIVARSDHSFIIADAYAGTTRFRRIGPDGLTTTVAGGGFSGGPIVEGEPAVGASIVPSVFGATCRRR